LPVEDAHFYAMKARYQVMQNVARFHLSII